MGRKSFFDIGLQFEKSGILARRDYYEDHEPIYFYHVSARPLHGHDDESFSMAPKFIDAEVDAMHINRICVAPTMEQCLTAIVPMSSDQLYVYRTVRKSNKSVIPFGVVDAPITQERWLTRERKFKLCAVIPRHEKYYNRILSDEDGSNSIKAEFDYRGSIADFSLQQQELTRMRKFFRMHDKNMFMNDIEKSIHDKQRNMKLRLNRYDLNRLSTTSSC